MDWAPKIDIDGHLLLPCIAQALLNYKQAEKTSFVERYSLKSSATLSISHTPSCICQIR